MTNLDCNVKECLYQTDNCCCREEIHVQGNGSEDKKGTCCGSYEKQAETGAKNSFAEDRYAAKETEVLCDAKNCVYNKDMHCDANHIGISGIGAATSMETQCASFVAK